MSYLFDLVMRCPSHNYNGSYVNLSCRTAGQWYHSKCGGKSQIYDDFTLRCSQCSRRDHIKNWKFYCSKQNDYYYIGAMTLADALTAFSIASNDPQLSLYQKRQINAFSSKLYMAFW